MRNYFEEMNIDYDELKSYEKIETYYDEVKDYSNLIQELQCDRVEALKQIVNKNKEIERLNNIAKEVREKINGFDVYKEFTFPLMKRDEENQVKSSIDYEWRKSIKEPLLKILDKVGVDKE